MFTTFLKILGVLPLVIGFLVGAAEIRSDARVRDKLRRLVPTGLAVALVGFFFLFPRVTDANDSFTTWLAGFMTALAIVVGLSGVLTGYSRRSSAVLMAVAGFVLAYYWAFFSLLRP